MIKKFIHASPVSGICLSFPHNSPRKMSPKYGSARLTTSSIDPSGDKRRCDQRPDKHLPTADDREFAVLRWPQTVGKRGMAATAGIRESSAAETSNPR